MQPGLPGVSGAEWPYGTAFELEDSGMVSVSDEGGSMIRRFAANHGDPRQAQFCVGLQQVGDECNNLTIPMGLNSPLICVRSAVTELLGSYQGTAAWIVELEYRTLPFFGRTSTHIERAEVQIPYWSKRPLATPEDDGAQWMEFAWTYPSYRIVLESTVHLPAVPGIDPWGPLQIGLAARQMNELHKLPVRGPLSSGIDDDVRGPNWMFIGADAQPVSKALGVIVTYSWVFEAAVNAPTLLDISGGVTIPDRMYTNTPDPRNPIPFTDPPRNYPDIRTPNIILPPSKNPWERWESLPDDAEHPIPEFITVDPVAKRRNNVRNENGTGWMSLPGIIP